jgi:Cys-rich protein (TIGR01571 family)
MYEVPFYAQHVDEELRHLRHSEKVLEDRLTAAQAKYSAAQKKWESDARRKREIAASAPAPVAAAEDSEESVSPSTSEEPQVANLETKDDGDISVDPQVTPEPLSPEPESQPSELALALEKAWKDYDKQNNFWVMSWPEQEVVLRNTFIYLVFGCAFAILYRYIQLKNPGVLDSENRGGLSPSDLEFSFSLFGCFGDLKTTGLAFCCSCCRWADTIDRQLGTFGVWQYWKAFGLMFILYLLQPFTAGLSILGMCVLGVVFRHALRVRFKMAHSTPKICCLDTLTWLFCMPCAIVQEAREEHLRYPGKVDNNLGLVPPSS